MHLRRTLPLLLAFAMLLSLCACGGGESGGTAAAKGAYTETKIELPKPENGVEQGLVGMYRTDAGLVCVTAQYDAAAEDFRIHYVRYTIHADGTVDTQPETWLDEGAHQGGNSMMLRQGPDGALYMSWSDYDENYNILNHILVSRDDGATAEELKSSTLDKLEMITALAVLADGSIAVQDYNGVFLLLDSDGSMIKELETFTGYGCLASYGSKLATYAPSGKAVRVYDMENGDSVDWDFDLPEYQAQLCFGPDGTLYLACPAGLYSHSADGSLWERFVDGGATNLGLPDYYVSDMAVEPGTDGEPDSVCIGNYGMDIFSYSFSADVPSVAERTLEVFSLTENKLVRQAVVEFNRCHDDVKASYTVAESLAAGGTTEDYIKALNAQLLAGDGPDVLLLDGLPLDSYIEKDVLSDLSSALDSAEPMLDNIRSACERDGKLYTVPLGFALPMSVTAADGSDCFAGLDALTKAVEGASELPILSGRSFSYAGLASFLLSYYGDELFDGDEGATEHFLDCAMRMSAAMGCGETVGEDMEFFSGMLDDERRTYQEYLTDNNFILQLIDYTDALCSAMTFSSRGLEDSDSMIACAVVDQFGGSLGGFGGLFRPMGLVGVNKAGENTPDAEDFVRTLLSSTVQGVADYSTGYPVNKAVLDALFAKDSSNMSCGYNLGNGKDLSAEWPNAQRRADVRQILDSVTTPLYDRSELIGMVKDAVVSALDGSGSLSEAAETIESVLSTYLSE